MGIGTARLASNVFESNAQGLRPRSTHLIHLATSHFMCINVFLKVWISRLSPKGQCPFSSFLHHRQVLQPRTSRHEQADQSLFVPSEKTLLGSHNRPFNALTFDVGFTTFIVDFSFDTRGFAGGFTSFNFNFIYTVPPIVGGDFTVDSNTFANGLFPPISDVDFRSGLEILLTSLPHLPFAAPPPLINLV